MNVIDRVYTILMADDDSEDCALVQDVLSENRLPHQLRTVPNGEALLDYLHRRGDYTNHDDTPRPNLVLLDLNMPKKDGREALRELKSNPRWKRLRVVVLTTSTAEDDIHFCYDEGAASFISKPVTYQAWVELMSHLSTYWFEIVELPNRE